ncbi:MAG: phosphatidylserine decarboxylase family protein [Bacteroidales bacterium]|nr:phosphatidylserine decarboxylase family protein [Bacteroidales bacterium]
MRLKIHKEGVAIIIINAFFWVMVILSFWFFSKSIVANIIMTAIGLFMALFMLRFFRVPEREPVPDDMMVVAPSDGKVVNIADVEENEFFKGPCTQISVYLNFFDIHISWFPAGGKVTYYLYHPGKYLFAWYNKSSDKNEHTTIGMTTNSGHPLMFRQIAGIVARRIVCYAKEGENFEQASQAGFIKFGSRMDVFVPRGTEILVKKGKRVKGQLTRLARFSEPSAKE